MRLTAIFGSLSSVLAIATLAALESIKVYRKDATFPWMAEAMQIVYPQTLGDGLSLVGAVASGLVLGLTLAAIWLTRLHHRVIA